MRVYVLFLFPCASPDGGQGSLCGPRVYTPNIRFQSKLTESKNNRNTALPTHNNIQSRRRRRPMLLYNRRWRGIRIFTYYIVYTQHCTAAVHRRRTTTILCIYVLFDMWWCTTHCSTVIHSAPQLYRYNVFSRPRARKMKNTFVDRSAEGRGERFSVNRRDSRVRVYLISSLTPTTTTTTTGGTAATYEIGTYVV